MNSTLVREQLFYGLTFVTLCLILTGCQFAQTSFTNMTSNAGAAFSAAALTLTYTHEGKVTAQYAQSSFQGYQSELDGLDQQLSSQQQNVDRRMIQRLLQLYKPAIKAVDNPCLDGRCDWQAQLKALNAASQAFLKAGGQ